MQDHTLSASRSPDTAPRLRHLQPDGLYDATPNGYTHVVTVEGPAHWVFVSGQGGEDQATHLPDEFATQARQALANLQRALQAAGGDMGCVARLTLLIVDHSVERFNDWQQAVRVHWEEGAPDDARPRFPACTLIPVSKLALPGMLIEVDAIAALPVAGRQARQPLWA